MNTRTDEMPDTSIKARLDHMEDRHGVVITEDNQKFLVAKERLPANIHEGDDLWIHIETTTMREEERRKMAKALLDEILNPTA